MDHVRRVYNTLRLSSPLTTSIAPSGTNTQMQSSMSLPSVSASTSSIGHTVIESPPTSVTDEPMQDVDISHTSPSVSKNIAPALDDSHKSNDEITDAKKDNRDTTDSIDANAATITPPSEPVALEDELSTFVVGHDEEGDTEMQDATAADAFALTQSSTSIKRKRDRTARPPPIERPKRAARGSAVYNLCKLSGTDVHGKRAAKGDKVSGRIRRKSAAAPLAIKPLIVMNDKDTATPDNSSKSEAATELAKLKVSASISQSSGISSSRKPTTLLTTRSSLTISVASTNSKRRRSEPMTLIANKRAVISDPLPKNPTANIDIPKPTGGPLLRELRRLRDTDEFAHIDSKPVVHTVWCNGKLLTLPARSSTRAGKGTHSNGGDSARSTPTVSSSKGSKKKDSTPADTDKEKSEDVEQLPELPKKRPNKKYLEHGLYAGQKFSVNDLLKSLNAEEKKEILKHKELAPKSSARDNKVLPSPIFNGLRMLIKGRDFKLPYDVFNPLPPGQSKPGEWRKMTKNRFIGDSRDYWRNTHDEEWQSKCVCKPEDGCGESCQNRIMLYECDEENCNVGLEYCTNRAFESLAKRKAQGNKYSMGVEVIKTENRGYGVRANRCFEPNQIIVEYTGEIITEEECQRRMQEEYKHNECFYLMSFDQNMILDATTGSIARFVNHSCKPNCRMVKWIVHGQPRMALFAGDEPIMTGDELTYDYKFDPFSSKNMQRCLCGSDNCRGWLTSKEQPQQKEAMKQQRAQAKAAAAEAAKKEKAAALRAAKSKNMNQRKIALAPAAAKKSAAQKAKVLETRRALAVSARAAAASKPAVKPPRQAPRTVARLSSLPTAAKRKRINNEEESEGEEKQKPASKKTKLPAQPTRRSGRHSEAQPAQALEVVEDSLPTRTRTSRRGVSVRLDSMEAEEAEPEEPSTPSPAVAYDISPATKTSEDEPEVAKPTLGIMDSDDESISSLSDVEIDDLEDIAETIDASNSERPRTANSVEESESANVTMISEEDPNDAYQVPTTPTTSKRKPGRPIGSKSIPKKPEPKEKTKDMGLTAAATLRKRAPQKSRVKRLPNGELACNKKWKVVARNPKSLAAEQKATEEAAKRALEAASRATKKKPLGAYGVGGSENYAPQSLDNRVRWSGPNREWFGVMDSNSVSVNTPAQPTPERLPSLEIRTTLSYSREPWLSAVDRPPPLGHQSPVSRIPSTPTHDDSILGTPASATSARSVLATINRPPPLSVSQPRPPPISAPPNFPSVQSTMAAHKASQVTQAPAHSRQQPRQPFLSQISEPVSHNVIGMPPPVSGQPVAYHNHSMGHRHRDSIGSVSGSMYSGSPSASSPVHMPQPQLRAPPLSVSGNSTPPATTAAPADTNADVSLLARQALGLNTL